MAYNADDYELNELIEHVGISEPFTREQFANTMGRLLNILGNSGKTEQMQFYKDIEDRINNEYFEEDEEDLVVGQPSFKMPSMVKKRHTITINSDKRTNRSESTSSFSWQLADEIDNVKQISIESYNIPKSWDNITSSIGNNIFGISYEQPIKFYLSPTDFSYNSPETDYAVKAMSPNEAKATIWTPGYKKWFGENIYSEAIGAGTIRTATGRQRTSFPYDMVDLSWDIVIGNKGVYTDTMGGIDISLIDTTPTPISWSDLSGSITAYKKSYVEVNSVTPYSLDISDAANITVTGGTDDQVMTFTTRTFRSGADLSANNSNYFRWYEEIDGEGVQLTTEEAAGIVVTQPHGEEGVSKFTSTTGEEVRTFEIKPPREFTLKTTSPTFSYVIIRTDGTDLTSSNIKETGDSTIMFMIKNADAVDASNIGDISYNTDLCDNLIEDFLNSRQPINYAGSTTPDIRGRSIELDTNNIADYRNLRNTYENILDNYEPNNFINVDTYETWTSFKVIEYTDNSLNIGTNMLKEDVQYIWEDISNVEFQSQDPGSDENWVVEGGNRVKYHMTLTERDDSDGNPVYVFELLPKTPLNTTIYFQIKNGHYGTFNSLLETINAMSPKTQYDKYIGDASASKVNGGELETMLSHVIDTGVGMPSLGSAITSHEMIRNAYKNDYGTSFFNTIDWKFEKKADGKHIKLSLLGGEDGGTVQLVMYDLSMNQVYKGGLECGGLRGDNQERNDGLDIPQNTVGKLNAKDTLCNKVLGLDASTTGVVRLGTAPHNGVKAADLRRVRNLNIMLIDYKNYAYVTNATQQDAAEPNAKLQTPWYYNEVVFDTSCNDASGAYIIEELPVYTANGSRQLTEAQIYSLNAIFESQERISNSTTINYRYRDYFLYGIGTRDKVEPGTSSNDGIMATYDSSKGKRIYTQPTRLAKFFLELVDQDYNLIDLNGIDIELVLNIDTELNTNK